MLSYGTRTLKLSSEFMLLALVASAVISPFTEVISGHLSDLIGCKRTYMIGACAIGLFAFPSTFHSSTPVALMIVIYAATSIVTLGVLPGRQAFDHRVEYNLPVPALPAVAVRVGGPSDERRHRLVTR